MLKDSRAGTLTATGFCLRKLEWKNGVWVMIAEVVDYDQAGSIFDVPDAFIDVYLNAIPFLTVSGAISIESVGGQFVKSVDGSYEAIIGLPMFKIRQALFDLDFYQS
jgi:predicted house-cleaning NTP pyrophosphatase (Maf/HAM1 superfamily)